MRRFRLASLSRSWAWSDFFQPEIHPLQPQPYIGCAEANPRLLFQPSLQLAERPSGMVGQLQANTSELSRLRGPGRYGCRSTCPLRLRAAEIFHAQPRLTP